MKEMKLTFLYYPRLDSIQHDIIEELSFHTSKLYNTANYECRENGFKKYTELEKMFKSNWHADYLHHSKAMQEKFKVKSLNFEVSKKLQGLVNWECIQQIRIKWDRSKKRWGFKRTKRINNLQNYRNSYMHDYMHKASSIILDIAKTYKVGTIVVGDLTGIKKGNRNKSFVQVPVWKIYELVKYKAEQAGIKVVKQKENYTSGVSSLDLEPVTKKYYDGSRRVHRGLFVSNKGLKINADINGSLNIMRKYLKDKCIPKPIVSARDKGYVTAPVRIRVACSNRWKHKYHTPYEASI